MYFCSVICIFKFSLFCKLFYIISVTLLIYFIRCWLIYNNGGFASVFSYVINGDCQRNLNMKTPFKHVEDILSLLFQLFFSCILHSKFLNLLRIISVLFSCLFIVILTPISFIVKIYCQYFCALFDTMDMMQTYTSFQ